MLFCFPSATFLAGQAQLFSRAGSTALALRALTSVPSGFDRCSSSYQFEDAHQRDRWGGAGIGRVCVNLRLLCLVSEELGTRGDAPEAALAILKVSSQLAAAGLSREVRGHWNCPRPPCDSRCSSTFQHLTSAHRQKTSMVTGLWPA